MRKHIAIGVCIGAIMLLIQMLPSPLRNWMDDSDLAVRAYSALHFPASVCLASITESRGDVLPFVTPFAILTQWILLSTAVGVASRRLRPIVATMLAAGVILLPPVVAGVSDHFRAWYHHTALRAVGFWQADLFFSRPWFYRGELERAYANADRVVILPGSFAHREDEAATPLLSVTNADELAHFHSLLKYPARQPHFQCLCGGGPRIEWYKGDLQLTAAAFKHGRAIQWQGFNSFYVKSVCLESNSVPALIEWLDARGVSINDFNHDNGSPFDMLSQ